MPAKRKAADNTGYLLEAWRPPDNSGAPLACLATTFTFDASVFEEDCLARFLDIQGSPEENGAAYLIEREEKMSAVTAAVLVDSSHARGARYLRWDLLPARLPRKGGQPILHAKVWLLVWERAVRLVVGSANLTRQGLRLNHEIFGVLDYQANQPGPSKALMPLLGFLRTAATWASVGPAQQRWLEAVDLAETKASDWATDRPLNQIAIHALVTHTGTESLLTQLRELLPGSAPDYAEVLSPFFDSPAPANYPCRELWAMMARDAEICFWLARDNVRSTAKKTFVLAPESLVALPPGRDASRSEVSKCLAKLEDNRPLHAKSLWLERVDRWAVYLIGSHNFTTPGYGLGSLQNAEASLVFIAKDPKARKQLAQSVLEFEEIEGPLAWLESTAPNLEDELPANVTLLPPEFGAAVFDCDTNGKHLNLHFTDPRGVWSVKAAEENGGDALYDEKQWQADGKPGEKRFAWTEPLPPSRLLVYLPDCPAAEWIVELKGPSSLPPPDELARLPLEALLEVLTTARPLHKALARWLEKTPGRSRVPDELDPHRRVDTSGFLLQRTSRFSRALTGLKVRLETPVVSAAALDWRLRGPVGVIALADAVQRDAPLAMEAAFLLAELYREFRRVSWQSIPGGLPTRDIRRAANLVTAELRDRLMAIQPSLSDESMREHLAVVLQ